jgi:hypothetical protein
MALVPPSSPRHSFPPLPLCIAISDGVTYRRPVLHHRDVDGALSELAMDARIQPPPRLPISHLPWSPPRRGRRAQGSSAGSGEEARRLHEPPPPVRPPAQAPAAGRPDEPEPTAAARPPAVHPPGRTVCSYLTRSAASFDSIHGRAAWPRSRP